ncbi:MAG: helix-turn-helix transcriptional regulator [Clostridia bacterium]|nr:helix-turn-helix transcriptional regulator [Clostridia bacterium]
MTAGEATRARIMELIAERNITVNKLAMKSGITQSTLQNITGGRNHSASVSTIQKLCDGLGISLRQFFDSDLFENLEQEIR